MALLEERLRIGHDFPFLGRYRIARDSTPLSSALKSYIIYFSHIFFKDLNFLDKSQAVKYHIEVLLLTFVVIAGGYQYQGVDVVISLKGNDFAF